MAYVGLDKIKRILRDDFLTYPEDMTPYLDFAETEINSRLIGVVPIPFDEPTLYATVPPLIQWVSAYLVGYKLYDERTAVEDLVNSRGKEWWDMAQRWLTGIVDGTYLLHLEDGTPVDTIGGTTGPRSYPTGIREKAANSDNVPYFSRSQAGEW